MKKIALPVHFYALVSMVFWGMSFIWSSILLRYYPPVTIILIRLILSTIFLWAIIYLFKWNQPVLRKDIPHFILSAVFNPFLYFLGENYGLKYSSPTIAAIIIATIPLFSPVAGYLVFREKLRWFNIVGICLSFSGISLMLFSKSMELQVDYRGILFLAGAVASAVFYSIQLKFLSGRYSPVNIIAIQNLIGIFLFLPFFLLLDLRVPFRLALNTEIIFSFIALAILASSLAFVFFVRAVRELGISKANIFSNLIPVFTGIFSFLMFSEVFTLQKIAGITVVIAGVYLSEITNRRG